MPTNSSWLPIGTWQSTASAPRRSLDAFDAMGEVRAHAVHLVDVADARHVVLVREAPVRLGLRLDAGHAVEHDDRAVEHAQAAVHLDREVDVAGRVDHVDLIALPLGRDGGALDRDAALAFLLEVVGRGAGLAVLGVVHLDDLVLLAGVIEHALGGRGLARVDVGDDADVAVELERLLPGHNLVVSFKIREAGGVNRRRGSTNQELPRSKGAEGREGPALQRGATVPQPGVMGQARRHFFEVRALLMKSRGLRFLPLVAAALVAGCQPSDEELAARYEGVVRDVLPRMPRRRGPRSRPVARGRRPRRRGRSSRRLRERRPQAARPPDAAARAGRAPTPKRTPASSPISSGAWTRPRSRSPSPAKRRSIA